MANDHDALTTGALLIGGGLAGYAIGHWLDRQHDEPVATDQVLAEATNSTTAAPAQPVSSPSQVSARNARSSRGAHRYTREGRTILRDGVAVLQLARVDLGDQRYAISPHETDVLVAQIVRLLNSTSSPPRRDARSKDPAYRERWLVDDRCGYRALMFWTGAPPETAVVGDVWAYLEQTSSGRIISKRRFRTKDEGYRYIKAALRRTLERAGKHDCYDY